MKVIITVKENWKVVQMNWILSELLDSVIINSISTE